MPTSNTSNLEVQVKDLENIPLAGAKVVSNRQPDGQLKVTALTDAEGKAIFSVIAPGEYGFYVNRFDYLQAEVALTVIPGQTTKVEINLVRENAPASSPSSIPLQVTFADLISKPEIYDQKMVEVEGFWFDGFEIEVLAERLEPDTFASGNVKPAGGQIWIKGGLPLEVAQQLYLQPNNPTGYPAHFAKVALQGKFETGSKYGHLNAYKYQMTVNEANLLNWSP
jgi:hypothetical protein